MQRKKEAQGPVVGGGKKMGIFLTKEDFAQLLEVIARGKAKDDLARRANIKQFGASGKGVIDVPTTGALGIQQFVRELAKAYGLPDPEGNLYGVNKHREFVKWVTREEMLRGMN